MIALGPSGTAAGCPARHEHPAPGPLAVDGKAWTGNGRLAFVSWGHLFVLRSGGQLSEISGPLERARLGPGLVAGLITRLGLRAHRQRLRRRSFPEHLAQQARLLSRREHLFGRLQFTEAPPPVLGCAGTLLLVDVAGCVDAKGCDPGQEPSLFEPGGGTSVVYNDGPVPQAGAEFHVAQAGLLAHLSPGGLLG